MAFVPKSLVLTLQKRTAGFYFPLLKVSVRYPTAQAMEIKLEKFVTKI